MHDDVSELTKLDSLLFQLSSAAKLHYPTQWVSEIQREEQRHTMVVTAGTPLSLYVNDQLIPAGEPSCYLLAPGNSWYISNLSSTDVEFYCIYFSIIRTDEQGPKIYKEQLLPAYHAWHM